MSTRRNFLSALVTGSVIGLAGCGTPPDPPNDETPTQNPKNTTSRFTGIRPETLPENRPTQKGCFKNGYTQHPVLTNLGNVNYGNVGPWELRITKTSINIGESFEIRLKNVSSSPQEMNPFEMYNLFVYTTDGWQELRWMKPQVEYPKNQSETLEPGGSHIWTFYSTDHGMIAPHPHTKKLYVCPTLQEGRYQFVFSNPAVGVQFNILTES